MSHRPLTILFVVCLLPGLHAGEGDWIPAMKEIHAKKLAARGSVAQIGDSITFSKAFLAGMAWGEVKGPEWDALKRIDGKLLNERKGAEHGNYSGWTSAEGLKQLPSVLEKEKPEIAVVMYGTNDARKNVSAAEYEKNMAAIVDACLAKGCIPIVSTIPPILNSAATVDAYNAVVKKIAAARRVPLIDFYAAILERQPGTAWDGTLLGKGDVHPSGGKNFDFSPENLRQCGYALRNYLTCLKLKDVVEHCLAP
jgi:lysophospholipase L1-like esterase